MISKITNTVKLFNSIVNKVKKGKQSGKKAVYISGPMTSYKEYNTSFKNHNYEAFHTAAKELSKHCVVLNPADNFDGNTQLNYSDYFLADAIQLLFADYIHTLDGWRKSKGATAEVLFGMCLGLPFVDINYVVIPAPDIIRIACQTTTTEELLKEHEQEVLEELRKKYAIYPYTTGFSQNNFVWTDLNEKEPQASTSSTSVSSGSFSACFPPIMWDNKTMVWADPNGNLTSTCEVKQAQSQAVQPKSAAENLLDEAKKIVTGDRRRDYNHPYENFKKIADMLNGYGFQVDGKPVNLEHVADAMIIVKLARGAHKYKADNQIDIVGYTLCKELALEKQNQLEKGSNANVPLGHLHNSFPEHETSQKEA